MRQDLETEAREEYASLLKEVTQRDEPELIARVCEQMLGSFPDEPEAAAALGRTKVALGEVSEAIQLLSEALPRFPADVSVREALVVAYEAEGDTPGVQHTYSEIAEIYRKRGDEDQARAILQRFVTVDELNEPDTAPSIILSDALAEETEETEETEEESLSFDFQPASEVETSETDTGTGSSQDAEDLLAEARISFEFGDMAGAEGRLSTLLEIDPDNAEGRELLALIRGESNEDFELEPTGHAPEKQAADLQGSMPGLAEAAHDDEGGGAPSQDSLPDIELMLEDDQDHDAKYASVDPPRELQEAELEIDLDASGSFELGETPPSVPVQVESEAEELDSSAAAPVGDWAAESMRINVDLEEAEFFFHHGMLDEAERAYREILGRAPNHPKATLRIGEITAARRQPSTAMAAPVPEAEPFATTDVLAGRSDAIALDARSPEDSFDLAAELEAGPEHDVVDAVGGGFEDVFRAFKREIQHQIGEDEAEAHYDLAIAYKEMGLLDDAVAELEIVRRAGRMPVQSFAVLLATCKLGLGRPLEAAVVLEEALSGALDDESTVSLRYELGEALLAAGKPGEALDAFRKVASVDPSYRDVNVRLAKLG
jgi:tetratricopeptide (TPR) repeat protein